ncbi:MAG: 2-amino-4-hydroxy-6-hydroxymethyldihydropteridine diphosphokinase [Clostridiales bacterium]|nr:2-amino-4-hydroxy-6-hydroxymethyldihydropteridine diphosphokinase [Clostridiales bacterium]
MEYIISVGTNLGDRKQNIENCINAINLLPYTDVTDRSAIYETEPIGYKRQENFYNILLKVESIFDPGEMLGACMGIEAGMGRIRTLRYGPRIIDLDIIFAENMKIESRNLSLPHPRYHERRFVLEPLLDLFPDGIVYDTDIKPFLKTLDGQEVKKVTEE